MELLCKWISDDTWKWDIPFLWEAEAKGRFRRLIHEEKASWDTPIYKAYKKHPGFIIGKGGP